ncbi:hypothetical protein SAMN04489724_2526 [Algoriphagus locisalis]|uniref:DoxX protein n=1 Tax=Algoriphagus locisalis TaxID=305507 RepID=A0A1I7BLP7_9BACT|nr:hypothetical protein [Algoriphagus locisalis]SFT88098.1 hypothetical protein SAMN04489724_2526 [Algoriphagus locisalis]
MNSTFSPKNILKTWIAFYIVVYAFPAPFSYIPFLYDFLLKYFVAIRDEFTILIAKAYLGQTDYVKPEMNGSGDTTFNYMELISFPVIALILAVFALVLFRKKPWITKLFSWSLIYARYYVGLILISYGVAKFMIGQFPSPSIYSLEQTFGESSPMGLAWRFFGYSDTYKIFMGLSEITAGLLLLFRRTTVLGALISVAVTTNIVLVNFSFDVPVKLMSSHLLLFSLLILLPSIKVLLDFFILQKPTRLATPGIPWRTKTQRRLWLAGKVLFAVLLPLSMIVGHFASQPMRTMYANEWDGAYTFSQNNLPDSTGVYWTQVMIDQNRMNVKTSGKNNHYYTIENTNEEGEIYFVRTANQEDPYLLKIRENSDGEYQLLVTLGEQQMDITATRKKKSDYFLMQRGFHWINEYSFNR